MQAQAKPVYSWKASVPPEAVAIGLSIVVVLAAIGIMGSGALTGLGESEVSGPVATFVAPSTGPAVERPSRDLIRRGVAFNARLVANGNTLAGDIVAKPPSGPFINDELRLTNFNLGNAISWSAELSRAPGGSELAGQLAIVYGALRRHIDDLLTEGLYPDDLPTYLKAVASLVDELRSLTAFESGLEALIQ